ncbi:MAG: hypothetical protein ACR2RV_02070 [Verrucomicrobiales bacterium]
MTRHRWKTPVICREVDQQFQVPHLVPFRLLLLSSLPVLAEGELRVEDLADTEGTLTVWGREIVVFRGTFESLTPKVRSSVAHSRLTSLPDLAIYE